MEQKGWHSRGYLPHFDAVGVVQAVTFRLGDSLPEHVVHMLKEQGKDGLRRRTAAELDRGYGSCALKHDGAAALVEQALFHFDGGRYRLLAWVVMPNHVHVVVETLQGWQLGGIVKSWKAFSAAGINRLLGRRGTLWQPDYFDRRIRGDHHLAAAVRYVEDNPVTAGLVARPEEWPYSSARARLLKDCASSDAQRMRV